MSNSKTQFDTVQGNAQISQVGGNLEGGIVGRDKNVTIIHNNLTVYLTSRPEELEVKPLASDIGPNPYKGLSAFQEIDAERFFGREDLTRRLWEKFCQLHEVPPGSSPVGGDLRVLRLLAILGPSGSGKSSVARAGLLHELARHPLPGKQKARVAVFTPGTRPLEALATILARIATNDPTPVTKKLEFTEVLKKSNAAGQMEGLRHIADVLPEIDAAPLILLIDQFEEIYSQCEDPAERQQFLDNLLCAAADRSGHLSVILTLRSDFLGQTQNHPDFNHALAAHEVLIPVMKETELRQAIAEPAQRAGHPLDDATVDLLIEQTRGHEGALPLLQFALTRIWDGLAVNKSPAETLKQIGGVGGALASQAQQRFDSLSNADKVIARRAFLRMIQLGEGTRDTRRRVSLAEIVAQGEKSAHVQQVVRWFADPRARMVTLADSGDGNETAEFTHEAILEHWDTLKEWVNSSREDMRFQRGLSQAAAEWRKQNQDPSYLYHGMRLKTSLRWTKTHGCDLSALEQEFLKKSAVQRKRTRVIVLSAIILPLITTVSLMMIMEWGPFKPYIEKSFVPEFNNTQVPFMEWGRNGVVYAGLGEGQAPKKVARSNDQGKTWKFLDIEGGGVQALVIHPVNPQYVYVALLPKGLFQSRDGGDTWQSLPDSLPFDKIDTLTLAVSSAGTLYAGDFNTPIGVYESTDDGKTWALMADSPKAKVTLLKWIDEQLLVGTVQGLWQWTRTTGWSHTFDRSGAIFAVVKVGETLFIAGASGLFKLEPAQKPIEILNKPVASVDVLASDSSRSLKLIGVTLAGEVLQLEITSEGIVKNDTLDAPPLVIFAHPNDPKQYWIGTMKDLRHNIERHWFDWGKR